MSFDSRRVNDTVTLLLAGFGKSCSEFNKFTSAIEFGAVTNAVAGIRALEQVLSGKRTSQL